MRRAYSKGTAPPSASPSAWVGASPSASLSASPSAWGSSSPSASLSAWGSPTPSASPSAWVSASPSASPSAWVSASASASPSASPSAWVGASPSAGGAHGYAPHRPSQLGVASSGRSNQTHSHLTGELTADLVQVCVASPRLLSSRIKGSVPPDPLPTPRASACFRGRRVPGECRLPLGAAGNR